MEIDSPGGLASPATPVTAAPTLPGLDAAAIAFVTNNGKSEWTKSQTRLNECKVGISMDGYGNSFDSFI